MKVLNMRLKFDLLALVFTTMLLAACGGDMQEIGEIPQDEMIVTEKTSNFKIDNKVFHLPNPVQISMLMKEIAKPYNEEALSPISNLENYSTSFKQAVNIGVYGADLGYIASNDKNQEALTHLGAVKKLSEALDVASAFDFSALEKFGSNVGDKEKMLSIITGAYKSCASFLQEENRHDLAGLMMAGAMIEGMHFTLSFANSDNKQVVIDQLGAQKQSLDNVILVLNPHYSRTNAPELSSLLDMLVDLQAGLAGLQTNYRFKESTVDEANKTCTINSTNTFKMNDATLKIITGKVAKIREHIIS